jgi:glutamyl-tRNA reductase
MTTDPAVRVLGELGAEGEAIRRREVETALAALDSDGALTARRREAIEELSRSLLGQILAPTVRWLCAAERADGEMAAVATARLFDLEVRAAGATHAEGIGVATDGGDPR